MSFLSDYLLKPNYRPIFAAIIQYPFNNTLRERDIFYNNTILFIFKNNPHRSIMLCIKISQATKLLFFQKHIL